MTAIKRYVTAFILLFALVCMSTMFVKAQTSDLVEGDFVYEIVDNEIQIKGYKGVSKDVKIPAEIAGLPVSVIQGTAFNSKNLTAVTLPSTLKKIEGSAFKYNKLTELVIPNSVEVLEAAVFANNEIHRLTLSNQLKEIPSEAFLNNKLTELKIPSSVEEIESDAFKRNELTKLMIPNTVKKLGYGAFDTNKLANITLSNQLMIIEARAFKGNQLKSITIPSNIVEIEDSAFASNQLSEINLPKTVEKIGKEAFKNNELTKFSIPEKTTVVASGAFANNKLTKVMIPSQVTKVESLAFANNKISEVNLGTVIETIAYSSFRNNQLTKLTIPSQITKVESSAFENNALTKITIPNNVKTVGMLAFSDNKLRQVTLEEGVEKIEHYAFANNQLKNIVIPNSAVKLGGHVFESNELTKAKLPNSLKVIPFMFFYDNQFTELTIPEGIEKIEYGAFAHNDLEKIIFSSEEIAQFNQAIDQPTNKYTEVNTGERVLNGWMQDEARTIAWNEKTANQTIYSQWNHSPVFKNVEDTYVRIGASFNPLKNVTATDAEDGSLTNEIMIQGTVDTSKVGVYRITYSVKDSSNMQTVYTREIHVTTDTKPILNVAKKETITAYNYYDVFENISATDKEDGDLYWKIKADKQVVNTKIPGIYTINYSVTDSDGHTVKVQKKLTVLPIEGSELKQLSATTNSIQLNWEKQSGVTGYEVLLYDQAGKYIKTVKTTTNSYTASKLKAMTFYSFKIRSYKVSQKQTLRGKLSSKVKMTTAPSTANMMFLKKGTNLSFSLKWTKMKAVSGYRLQYSTSNKFTTATTTTKIFYGKANNRQTIYKVKKGQTYYVRVQAYKTYKEKNYYGTWSKIKSVKIPK